MLVTCLLVTPPMSGDVNPTQAKIEERDKDMLAHLSAVIRYSRLTTSQIQKVGEPSDALFRDQAATQAGQIADLAFESAKAEAVLLDTYERQHAVLFQLINTRRDIDQLDKGQFSQEIILLEQARANLVSWHAAVNGEYH